MTMTRTEIFETMREALRGVSSAINWDAVTEDDDLKLDLGFDSLLMMLVAIQLEEVFGVEVTEADQFATVGDVCDYVEERL